MILNGIRVEAFRSNRVHENAIAIPAETRNRLGVNLGDSLVLGPRLLGPRLDVVQAFIEDIRAAESLGVSQDHMVFFGRRIPGTTLRSLNSQRRTRVDQATDGEESDTHREPVAREGDRPLRREVLR